jgi:hypothetical protein
MPATNFPDYAGRIQAVINELIATGEAHLLELEVDARSQLRGHISGVLQFENGSELHFNEFVDVNNADPRLMYAYHYQDADKRLVFRYDNAMHRPSLPQLDHKHTARGIELSTAPQLAEVLDEIAVSWGKL